MKRPKTVYLLVGFYLLLVLLEAGMFFQPRIDLFKGAERLVSPWSPLVGRSTDQAILVATALPMIVSLIGIWLGKSWGRNLSLAFCILVVIYLFLNLLKVFTIFVEGEFRSGNALLYGVKLAGLMMFVFAFYLSLRPELGRFCGVYPRERPRI